MTSRNGSIRHANDADLDRKCGRVVCASCSPHRITIPYQYIVVPPGAQRPGLQRYPSSLISGEGGYADFSSLGGGERVRLCNPCVPDPNTNPPQSQGSPNSLRGHGRSQSSVGSGLGLGLSIASGSRPPPYYAGRVDDAFGRNRSVTMVRTSFSWDLRAREPRANQHATASEWLTPAIWGLLPICSQ